MTSLKIRQLFLPYHSMIDQPVIFGYMESKNHPDIDTLMSMAFQDLRSHLETYSVEQLEAIIENKELNFIDYSLDLSPFSDKKSWPSNERLLDSILMARKYKLNDTFIPTPEHIRRLLEVNDRLLLCFEKGRDEAYKIMEKLDRRIKDKDDFFNGYHIEVILSPNIRPEKTIKDYSHNIYGIISLTDTSLKSNTSYYRDSRYDELCWEYLNPDFNCVAGIEIISEFFQEHRINYGFQVLWEDSFFSLDDIMNINLIYLDINVSHQGYFELNFDNKLSDKGEQL